MRSWRVGILMGWRQVSEFSQQDQEQTPFHRGECRQCHGLQLISLQWLNVRFSLQIVNTGTSAKPAVPSHRLCPRPLSSPVFYLPDLPEKVHCLSMNLKCVNVFALFSCMACWFQRIKVIRLYSIIFSVSHPPLIATSGMGRENWKQTHWKTGRLQTANMVPLKPSISSLFWWQR